MLRVFVGWDSAEADAALVCAHSIYRRSTADVRTLRQLELRAAGLYHRRHRKVGAQWFDEASGEAFTTEFSFTRYLVPAVAEWGGWALFCDCDFLFLADVAELFALADERYAVMVCKQAHRPAAAVKMEGQIQARYERKNWASLMLWNCAHPANHGMVRRANEWPKRRLHQLDWLSSHVIGELPPAWNWIEGVTAGEPKAVHFTAGLPRMPGYENCAYAAEWREELAHASGEAAA